MNDFIATLNALIAANGLNPSTTTLAQLIELANGDDTGYDYRGFSKETLLGSVRIRGIDKLRQMLADLGRADVASLVPIWHVTDYWNANKSTSLEGINTLPLSDEHKAFLNRNMNRWFFIPGGVSGTPTIPTDWRYYISGLQTPWGGVWSSGDAGRRAPFFAAQHVRLVTRDNGRQEYVLDGTEVPSTYVWPMSVDCSSTAYHVAFWKAYAEAVTGLTFDLGE